REDDGLAAVRLVEGLRLEQVLAPEDEAVLLAEERRPRLPPEEVAGVVAEDRGGEQQRQEDPDVEVTLVREESGGEQQAVAREDEPDEQPRLGVDDEEEPGVAERLYEVARIE